MAAEVLVLTGPYAGATRVYRINRMQSRKVRYDGSAQIENETPLECEPPLITSTQPMCLWGKNVEDKIEKNTSQNGDQTLVRYRNRTNNYVFMVVNITKYFELENPPDFYTYTINYTLPPGKNWGIDVLFSDEVHPTRYELLSATQDSK
ncbi:hypothetical protein SAMN04488002_1151 [Litoreibacter janthinus]|uniref:Uncharacterized protein n=1 Tax=Litoreibacter janthinus TaxID=670154 RepID=A0A1I6GAF9_9RHOB|nr:hypothetical protein SAMN04488002_1151 [Litoreibacter janthinus]